MLKTLSALKELALDILLPKKCLGCGREGHYICRDCEIFLGEVNMFDLLNQTSVMSVWEYEGIIEKAIRRIKFDGCYDIINELTDKAFEKIELNLPPDACVAYVPMYRKKEKERGFNQARLIAEGVGNKIGRPVKCLLEKTKDSPSQVGLGPKERPENVKDVFALTPLRKDNPCSVLLVDDVYTTGATMGECMKVLRKAGIKNVYGFTIARKLSL